MLRSSNDDKQRGAERRFDTKLVENNELEVYMKILDAPYITRTVQRFTLPEPVSLDDIRLLRANEGFIHKVLKRMRASIVNNGTFSEGISGDKDMIPGDAFLGENLHASLGMGAGDGMGRLTPGEGDERREMMDLFSRHVAPPWCYSENAHDARRSIFYTELISRTVTAADRCVSNLQASQLTLDQ